MDSARLENVPLFAGLPRRKLQVVAEHADEVELPAGSTLVEEGRLAYELFVILEGKAEVLEGETKLAEVGPGDVVGEIGILETITRTATVVATTPIKAIVMYGPELRALDKKLPGVFAQLQALVRKRLDAKH